MNEHLEKVAAHHDWEAEEYDAHYGKLFQLYHAITWDNLRRFLPERHEKPILDAGGGTGLWAVELARRGHRVVLTDISQGMLDQAEIKISELELQDLVETVVADICAMGEFEADQFSMVVCQGDPLSYCGDHESAMRQLTRVLEPGGVLVASVDNRIGNLNWLRDKVDRQAIDRLLDTGQVTMPAKDAEQPTFAVHAFTPKELGELCEANGLAVERMIGKPVIAHRLSCYRDENPQTQSWLLSLELKHNDHPDYIPWGGHLEIAARKRQV